MFEKSVFQFDMEKISNFARNISHETVKEISKKVDMDCRHREKIAMLYSYTVLKIENYPFKKNYFEKTILLYCTQNWKLSIQKNILLVTPNIFHKNLNKFSCVLDNMTYISHAENQYTSSPQV